MFKVKNILGYVVLTEIIIAAIIVGAVIIISIPMGFGIIQVI